MMNWLGAREEGSSSECEYIGEAQVDIAGIGIIAGFVGQAIISQVLAGWVFFLSKHGRLDIQHDEGTVEHKIERKRLKSVSEILMVGNDIQVTLGISYMITVFSYGTSMSLYHLRLVFDIVAFVGVSNAAAMVCFTFCQVKLNPTMAYEIRKMTKKPRDSAWIIRRYRATYLYVAMFTAHTIYLCVILSQWEPDEEPGRCYHSHLVTDGNNHPTDDLIYVVITSAWLLASVLSGVFLGVRRRHTILFTSFLQFPLHLWMAIALRQDQQGKFAGEEETENSWDFGQTTAVVLLGVAVVELWRKALEFWRFERNLRDKGLFADEEEEDAFGIELTNTDRTLTGRANEAGDAVEEAELGHATGKNVDDSAGPERRNT